MKAKILEYESWKFLAVIKHTRYIPGVESKMTGVKCVCSLCIYKAPWDKECGCVSASLVFWNVTIYCVRHRKTTKDRGCNQTGPALILRTSFYSAVNYQNFSHNVTFRRNITCCLGYILYQMNMFGKCSQSVCILLINQMCNKYVNMFTLSQ